MNSTESFSLTGYLDLGWLRYLCFAAVLAAYLLIVGSNVLLMALTAAHRGLHQPMYLFLCSLLLNQLYGSAGLFPFLLTQLLSAAHRVPAPLCLLQVFVVHSYGAVEFLTLAVMSYDRYLAICWPLQYRSRMTTPRMAALITASWLYPWAAMVVSLGLIAPLRLCGNRIQKVYCDMHSVVKLACSDTRSINAYGLAATFGTILAALLLILYTYVKILAVCFSGSRRTRQKALHTCTPHLASILNFSFAGSFEISQSRFDMSYLPQVLRVFLSLYFMTVPPLFNPIVYGLKMAEIRKLCRSLFLRL